MRRFMICSPHQITWVFKSSTMKCAGHITHTGGKKYRGADKSLAGAERKQARNHVRDARDFKNIETRAAIKFFFYA